MTNFVPSKVKVVSSFIKNDQHVGLYFFDIANGGARPILRINVVERSQQPSTAPPLSQPQLLVDTKIMCNEGCND